MADPRVKPVYDAVAETFPDIHWEVWPAPHETDKFMGGFDGYAYGIGMIQFDPQPMSDLVETMIAWLRDRLPRAKEPSHG